MGKIFQRKRKRPDGTEYTEGTWWIRFYDPTKGYSVNECVHSEKRKDAERMLRDREKAKDDGESIPAPATRKTMVVELLELLRDDYRLNKRKDTYSVEKRLDNHLIPFFQNYRARAVDGGTVAQYVKLRTDQKAAPASINRELSHISKAYRLGMDQGKVKSIPRFTRLSENNRRKGFFEQDDFLAVYAHLQKHVQPIAELAYLTGMRLGEIVSLTWEQVDMIACCIRLEETKNGDAREIHYGENPGLRSMIDQQWQRKLEVQRKSRRKIERLFFYNNGKPVRDFRFSWHKALKAANVDRIFHDLRRTGVRNLIRAGVQESTAMLISGHNTRSMLDRYNIRDPQATRAALGKVSLNFEHQIEHQIPTTQPQLTQTKDLETVSTRRVQ